MRSIAVVMGGPSSEYEVSLKTGINILQAIDLQKYKLMPVVIGEDGKYHMGGFLDNNSQKLWNPQQHLEAQDSVHVLSGIEGIAHIKEENIDLVFNAMHGRYGEDGMFQALLEAEGIPYTGSSFRSSSIAMHKFYTKKIAQAVGLPLSADFYMLASRFRGNPEEVDRIIPTLQKIGEKLVLKLVDSGSSRDMAILDAQDSRTIRGYLLELLDKGDVLVEEFIPGREFTCGILEKISFAGGILTREINSLSVTEIRPKVDSFFSYEAKYEQGASEEITPAQIPDHLKETIQNHSLQIHQALSCSDYSRSDFIYDEKEDRLVFLEINTLPGMTATSLIPQGAAACGISFADLVQRIIDNHFNATID